MRTRVGIAGALGALALAIGLSSSAGAGIGPVPGESLGNSHGLHYVLGTYDSFGEGNIVVDTPCQKGIIAPFGGGVDTTGSPKRSRLSGSTISKGHWYGEAQNLSSATKEIRVFAICPTDDMAPVEFGFDEIEVPGGQSRSQEVTCDGGTLPVGGGVRLNEGSVTRSEPFDDADPNKTPDGWRVRGRNWQKGAEQLTVGVACLDIPRQDVEYAKRSRKVEANKAKTVRASCPKAMSVASGGFTVGGGLKSFGHSAIPADSKADGNDVPDDRFVTTVVNGGNRKAKATATAVCLDG